MKTILKQQIFYILAPALLLFGIQGSLMAQRFSHPAPRGRAGGYYSPHPVPAPHPAPAPRPVPVPVPRPVPVPAYHYPYYYHPFTPFYWGPVWHPIGFIAATLTTAAIIVTVDNMQYHYDSGVYYVEESNGYKVVPAPVGALVSSLPDGYVRLAVSGATYYYYGGAFYISSSGKYKVVAAPAGAVVAHLPEGTEEVTLNGQKYVTYNGTYYEPISQDGKDAYIVVETK